MLITLKSKRKGKKLYLQRQNSISMIELVSDHFFVFFFFSIFPQVIYYSMSVTVLVNNTSERQIASYDLHMILF